MRKLGGKNIAFVNGNDARDGTSMKDARPVMGKLTESGHGDAPEGLDKDASSVARQYNGCHSALRNTSAVTVLHLHGYGDDVEIFD